MQRLFKEGLESDDTFGNRSAWLHATERSQHRTGNGSALHLFVQLFGKQDIYRDQGGHFKVGGKNAGNSRDLAIKGDCLAEDAGITRIAVFPERVRKNRDARTVRAIFFRRKVASENELHAQSGEKGLFYASAAQANGALLGQVTF